MSRHCHAHRSPSDPCRILEALMVATGRGHDAAAVLACLDQRRRPLTMFVLDEAPPDARPLRMALDVVLEAVAAHPEGVPLGHVVAASCRPGEDTGPTADDHRSWYDLDRRCEGAGVVLLDWFVISRGVAVSVPGHLGLPERW